MAYLVSDSTSFTTTTGATDTIYLGPFTGYLHAVQFDPSTVYVGATKTIKVLSETNGIVALTSAVAATTSAWTYYPRVQVHDTTAGGKTYGTTGDDAIVDRVPLVNERIQVNVYTTEASKTPEFTVMVDGAKSG